MAEEEKKLQEVPAEDSLVTESSVAEESSADKLDAEDKTTEAKWYVAHTYSGYENKVKANLDKTIENRHLEDQILEVRVPLLDVVEVKNGAKKNVQRKMFPGYVLVHMIMNDETWYVVRNTRGVTGFVGPGSKPVPLSDAEIKPLGIKTENISVDFGVGDEIAVIAGVWKDTAGVVQRMDFGKQTATINVELFGRETPVEISFAEVRRIDG
ncbi:transcription termination/antitermination protein NusG [Butyrivibrio sp. MC2013]|uniref:transcription termination/antitermination protein NusG n=1 Tax=Butyrivibrio sp. MC2013 TaxID=1280686 RepID=UPI000420F570|nr:transcription termination/antitermination protein NusG [Butyrivibrio sp. MC2013]